MTENLPADERPLKKWQLNPNKDGNLLTEITARPLNGYIPLYRKEDLEDERILASKRQEEKTAELIDQIEIGEPKTFAHIGVQAKIKLEGTAKITGTEAIGVLKADVDNLGMLIGCGLPDERFSFSRLATVSRQLDGFFSIYLPQMLASSDDFRDVYTVFAGGDDLFLIGPWNRMAALATYLKERFAEYVCQNDSMTFSAGISIHKSGVPVDKLAFSAETALAQSKDAKGKNSLTMFGQTVNWADFIALLENKQRIQYWISENLISSGMLYRFNELVELAGREKIALERGDVDLQDLDAMKWRSMFGYTVQRNLNASLKGPARDKAMMDVALMADWMNRYGAAVIIPLWHILYDKRS